VQSLKSYKITYSGDYVEKWREIAFKSLIKVILKEGA